MVAYLAFRPCFVLAHPLRLSLCEVDFQSDKELLTVNLKLFLTDVNEALVFDPYSKELAFCQPTESEQADGLLLSYLNESFYVKVNEEHLPLEIKSKKLSGEGDNTALWVYFEFPLQSMNTIEVKNAVFTDLFFDQNNIVYVHHDDESKSLMLNKKTTTHQLTF
jgi:hypothetical protein